LQHVDWIADCLQYSSGEKIAQIDAHEGAENNWVDHVNEVADATVYPRANYWYVGANIPGKLRVFMPYVGGLEKYRKICDEVAANNYQGFSLQNIWTFLWASCRGARPTVPIAGPHLSPRPTIQETPRRERPTCHQRVSQVGDWCEVSLGSPDSICNRDVVNRELGCDRQPDELAAR
jgi:hypothetical protein